MGENDKADDSPKKSRPQNRFSSPVFNEKLMSDLGNVLKKKKSPTNVSHCCVSRLKRLFDTQKRVRRPVQNRIGF